MTRFNKPHIDISALGQRRTYTSNNSSPRKAIQRIRDEHGPPLFEDYVQAFDEALEARPSDPVQGIEPDGVVLEFQLHPQAQPAQLDRKSENTRQGAVRVAENGAQFVALIIPDDKRDVMERLIDEYLNGELNDNDRPPNYGRIDPIDAIRSATFETFWRDDPKAIPSSREEKMWWGVWCFNDAVDRVANAARRLKCRVAEPDTYLRFPDVTVVPIYATQIEIEILLFGTLGIAEIRRASDSPTFFTSDVRGDEREWMDEYAERVNWPPSDAPTVCLLDTGVNRAHPLIEPALSPAHMEAIQSDWLTDDHAGHGTGMAGLALHGDLTAPLGDTAPRALLHRVESVKIIPPDGFDPNAPHAYGSITQSAVSLAEYANTSSPFRTFCLAITNQNRSGADATAWSAAIDQSAAGAMIGDSEEDPVRRLFVISAGNIEDQNALDAMEEPDAYPAEDPSQAWNAITVGGFTDKTQIQDKGYDHFSSWAEPGELSPFSRTSFLWNERKSPTKPDLVFEAGNRAVSPAQSEAVAGLPSLSLLSTGPDIAVAPFEPFWATSAAAAQAARMATQISAAHPEYWPETVRALMIHSAYWTEPMLVDINKSNKTQRAILFRRYGYGVPNLERALGSAQNNLAIVAQREIQPFRQRTPSDIKFNDAHVYPLPWPAGTLEGLGETPVRLKVTLSYFIEPNPSFSSSIDPFRYQSHGLRFDLKNPRETRRNFLRRRNKQEMEEGDPDPKTEKDKGWLLGGKQNMVGSLHCDIWQGTAAELAARNALWVYPVSGWWRERAALDRAKSKTRYSLILTVETKDEEINLYTPIENMVETLVDVEIG
ncbi:MAG: S8 family peptidase [Pseudomonadota bacterium]